MENGLPKHNDSKIVPCSNIVSLPTESCNDAILRAPTRKRKTPEPSVQPRIIRMTWDVDQEHTNTIMRDVGVSLLAPEGLSADPRENHPQPTSDADNVPTLAAKAVGVVHPYARTVRVQSLPAGKLAEIDSQFTMSPLMTYIDSEQTSAAVGHTIARHGDPWCSLSDEIILSVFGWLSKTTLTRCAQVCKRWKMLAYDETLWKSLDLGGKTLKRGDLGRVLERGVCTLRLARSEVMTPLHGSNASSFLHTRLNKVQYLDLSMATITPVGLEELLCACYNLRRLSLESCELNTNICRYIGQNRNMEVLNLCMCQGLTENALVPICNNLHKLDALNLAWTNMSRGALVYVIISLPATVTKLNLSGCRDTLQDEDVLQLCGSCPHLSELDLSDAGALTAQSVECIVHQLPRLRYLALSRCYKITLEGLALVTESRLLEAMDVFGMLKDAALKALAELLTERKVNFRLNKCPYSSIARPTTGIDRTKIWGLRTRDRNV